MEHRDDALGVADRSPRVSWRLPEGATTQHAYEIRRGDGVSSGRVESPENVLRPWPGQPLTSRQSVTVQVRVWTDLGESDWCSAVSVEAGLDAGDWISTWISPDEADSTSEPGFRPAYRLRGEVLIPGPVEKARLHVTAHGLHETTINGSRINDVELAPGFTEYPMVTQVMTVDVTDLVHQGRNAIGALLADGWFRGSVGMPRSTDQFGARTAYLAQLEVTHPDGSTTVVGTDASWRSSLSHILAADLIEGQSEDRRLVEIGWDTVDHDCSSWSSVLPDDSGFEALVPSPAPAVREVREITPVAVRELAPGRHVVDLGENINGRVRLSSLGPSGTRIRLVHGESLDAAGDVTTGHLRPDNIPFLTKEIRAGQVDEVISAGRDGDVFDPRFTTHGFRYVRVEGHPGPLSAADITGIVVNTDLKDTGGFTCSDSDLNDLHAAAVRSFRGNACDIPTDCPTRERAGWTGDWQVYSPIATFHDDVAGFSAKWLRDLAAAQWDNGIVGNMAPMPPAERSGFLERLNGSAGWGDAIVQVPWEMYLEYGDVRLLEQMWPHMVRWLDFASSSARDHRHPDRAAARPVPAPHEKYVWDSGFHWGEWLVPGEDPSDFPAFMAADKSDVATAFLSHSARVASQVADTLGRPDEATEWADLADNARDAWRAEFVDADGRITPHTQANLVRALSFDLVPTHHRQRAADDLATLVRENDTHLATGFLATRDLLPVLADNGHLDLAYALLRQDTPPSWMAMLRRGATTMWERWEGVDDDGVPHESLNHYSKGAVIGFLHQHVAGLRRTEPTWRRFRVQPLPDESLTWASAWHDSPHGRIESAWERDGSAFTVHVTVPPGCAADVVLPDGTGHEVGTGSHRWSCVV